MAEADWSELPKDLLNLISERLDNEIDFIRFRSICSTWRSSTIPYHDHLLSFKFPPLLKRSHLLIKPSSQQQQVRRPWLIRITKYSTGKTNHIPPHCYPPSNFHSIHHLNFIKLSVLHLGTNFLLDQYCPTKVVVVTPLMFTTLIYNYKYNLVTLRCGDESWTEVPGMSMSIGDFCLFKGQLYAVGKRRSTLVKVAPEDLSVQLVVKEENDYRHRDIEFLVESEGELLLVDVYEYWHRYDAAGDYAVRIDVLRLDEKKKKWVQLPSLGDRILFLGKRCSFSTSASDLNVAFGSCVFFMDDVLENNKSCESGMCVYYFDQYELSPLSDCYYPDYRNLFWPPPKWITKGRMHKSKKSMLSCT